MNDSKSNHAICLVFLEALINLSHRIAPVDLSYPPAAMALGFGPRKALTQCLKGAGFVV